MKSVTKAVLIVLPLGLAALVGCAVGDSADEPEVGFLVESAAEAGAEKDDSVTIPSSTEPSTPSDDGDDEPDAGAPDDGNGGAKPDAGNPDAGGDPGGNNGGSTSCAAMNTCLGATDLGSISGDKNADTKSTQGYTSEWFQVRVTENVTGLFSAPRSLRMTATLTSAPGTNFDLYVYVPSIDTRECSIVTAKSTNTTSTDKAKVVFGEDESALFGNGDDDDRTVTIEVRHVSGTCDAANAWSLFVEGNK